MVTLPGFGAESSLGGLRHRGAGTAGAGIAGDTVYPAQFWVDALSKWREWPGHAYVVPECPPGLKATLIKTQECEWWLPIYECRFTGGGNYECFIRTVGVPLLQGALRMAMPTTCLRGSLVTRQASK